MISDEQYLQFSPYFAQEDIEAEDNRLRFLRILGELPQAVKELLTSTETIEKIIKIGGRFELDEFDTEALSMVVRKLATGEVSIVQGAELVATEVGLPEEKANNLFNSIINDVLAPVLGGSSAQKIQPAKPSQKPAIPSSNNLTPPELGTADPRVIDLRNRQN